MKVIQRKQCGRGQLSGVNNLTGGQKQIFSQTGLKTNHGFVLETKNTSSDTFNSLLYNVYS